MSLALPTALSFRPSTVRCPWLFPRPSPLGHLRYGVLGSSHGPLLQAIHGKVSLALPTALSFRLSTLRCPWLFPRPPPSGHPRYGILGSSHAPLLQAIHGTVSLARLNLLTTSGLPGRKPLVMVALPDSQYIHLFFCVLFNGEVFSINLLNPFPWRRQQQDFGCLEIGS